MGLTAIQRGSAIRLQRLDNDRPLGRIVSLRDGQYAVISPNGHFHGSPGVEKELVYVVQTEEGQRTLTAQEFSAKYGWKNDPRKVEKALIGDG